MLFAQWWQFLCLPCPLKCGSVKIFILGPCARDKRISNIHAPYVEIFANEAYLELSRAKGKFSKVRSMQNCLGVAESPKSTIFLTKEGLPPCASWNDHWGPPFTLS